MLGFGKDANYTVAPGGIGTLEISLDSGFGFATELMKFIVGNAVSKKVGIEGNALVGMKAKSRAPLIVEMMT